MGIMSRYLKPDEVIHPRLISPDSASRRRLKEMLEVTAANRQSPPCVCLRKSETSFEANLLFTCRSQALKAERRQMYFKTFLKTEFEC